MTPEAMERAYQDEYARSEREADLAEAAALQLETDAAYGHLENEPDTLVRGLP